MANLNTDTGETPDAGYDNKYFCDRLYDHRYRCYISRVCVKIWYANCIFLIKQDGNVKPLAVQSLSKPGQEQIWFKTRIIDEYVETYNHDGKWRLWFDLIKN